MLNIHVKVNYDGFGIMVFNATFDNISAISWLNNDEASLKLVENLKTY